jgi:RecB family endonuclease NucS
LIPDPEVDQVKIYGKLIPEKIVEDVVVHKIPEIEKGLTLVGRQVPTPVGRIDLLCKDATGANVVIEIKKAQGTDQVLGQILRYMGWLKENKDENVRGIIIVQRADRRLSVAVKVAPNVQIKEFEMFKLKSSD